MRVGPLPGGSRLVAAAALAGVRDPERIAIRLAPRFLQSLWRGPVTAMTIGNRVYIDPRLLAADPEAQARLLLHELVHVRQWRDVGPVRFLVRYVTDYLRARLAGSGHEESYRGIRYEVEARRIAGH